MTTTSTLHIASSLLLLPYGLLCVSGIKAKLDPDVSETELGGEKQGTFVAWIDRFLLLDFHAISRGSRFMQSENASPWFYLHAMSLFRFRSEAPRIFARN
jgi:hypothetical protein